MAARDPQERLAANTPGVLLGIDLGTTAVKALVIDALTGTPLGQASRAYPSSTAADGRHEQDPQDWWRACREAVREAMAGLRASDVLAVGLSGHMHAAVLVDADDRYVRPVITWADRRSTAQVRRLQRHAGLFAERCANPVVEAFTAPKVAWLAEHEPESLERAVRLVQPKDSLRHRLTGTWGTDGTDARGTLLYDVNRETWDEELWRLCGANFSLGPEVSPSTRIVGHVSPDAQAATGLLAGTPVVAGASDVACAALGAGLVHEGVVYVNAGTAAQVLVPVSGAEISDRFLFGRADSPGYLAMTSVYAAGLSADWAARTLLGGSRGAPPSGQELDRLARQESAGASGAVFVPHLLGTSAPTHDPHLRGALLGLGLDHRPATVARAVLEGVAYACASSAQHVASSASRMTELRVGGGLAGSHVWSETLAAVSAVPVRRLRTDASPLGAAMLAGLGIGVWTDAAEAAETCVALDDVPVPTGAVSRHYRATQRRYELTVEALLRLSERTREADAAAAGTASVDTNDQKAAR